MAQQRLIVCLDGTWNLQDSSTNVLHHFNVVHEGPTVSGVVQRRYYHRGVGTGVLDGVTGGGFGFGLEQNVRDAYNWLVQHYCDGGNGVPPDEIFVFGFSRGAYTARSLVGFISQCGLLRRGAPVTVKQLWQDYCLLGRQREQRRSVWERLLWKPEPRVRQFTTLERAHDLTPNEQLLMRWSRRVNITYLGIYDTVGAIGWDALAIPGLTSKLAMHNNMRATTIIQNCRHALAIDEHRSSFNHTPIVAFVGHDLRETHPPADPITATERYWAGQRAMWRRKIRQRWFVGAHSNIGGGYEDNRLAVLPLQWLLHGANRLGLVSEPIPAAELVTHDVQVPRDSFAEFAPPVWTWIIRAKRNYRTIDPHPAPQASARRLRRGSVAPGYALQTIREEIDPTVFAYWRTARTPIPPNLQDYAGRKKGRLVLRGIEPAKHTWLPDRVTDYVVLAIWSALAAVGLCAVDRGTGLIGPGARFVVACAVAFLLPLVDWAESVLNFKCVLHEIGPFARAARDAIYWTRALGLVLFLIGLVYAMVVLPHRAWTGETPALDDVAKVLIVPVCAAVSTLLATGLKSRAWISLIIAPLAAGGGVYALLALGWLAGSLFPEIPRQIWEQPKGYSLPGLLLLLQLSVIYFWRALAWTAEPMSKAHLGSIVPLQQCRTPGQVAECLEHWRELLINQWKPDDEHPATGSAARRMRELVGQSLWRDIIGFIPVYSLVFLLGLWFAATELPDFQFLSWPGGGLALWWMVPALAAATDYLEDICHLRYCSLHADGKKPSLPLTLFSYTMSKVKGLAFLVESLLTVAAIGAGTWAVRHSLTDWRAKIAVVMSAIAVLMIALTLLAKLIHAARRGRRAVR